MKVPTKVPEPGFYFHYKHDFNGPINEKAYKLIGVGCHTEEEGVNFAVYQPLYKGAFVFKAGKLFDIRPIEMFMEPVTKDGKTFPRFTRITDDKIIAELKKIRAEMYPDWD